MLRERDLVGKMDEEDDVVHNLNDFKKQWVEQHLERNAGCMIRSDGKSKQAIEHLARELGQSEIHCSCVVKGSILK